MKLKFLIPIFLLISFIPSFGAISDSTGLREVLEIRTSGHVFEIETVGNYNIQNYEFDKDKQQLTLNIDSGLENNLGEIILPNNLLGGNLTFYLNDEVIFPKVKTAEKISFITLNFTGQGINILEIFGTEYLTGLDEIIIECSPGYEIIDGVCTYVDETNTEGGGCLIATAAFGSELAPQVQHLREIRDNVLLSTNSGESFMKSFNQFYYSFSPYVADYERENPLFKEAVKIGITPMLSSLSIMTLAESGSEYNVLTTGISVIALNLGMYLIAPSMLIVWLTKRH